ncbi:hypothetical protein Slin14017_G090720 [Septoria linicola]|nr:hypothetical protein Slin14017_G090720 [Septoria linicola]
MTDKTDSTNRRSPSPDSPFEMATTPAVAYNEWYEQRHIPDTFKTSGMAEAYRWKALNPEAERPFLNVYPLQDVAFLGSDEFETIPIDDGQLPGSGRIFDLVEFDTRCYRPVQSFEHKAFPASEAAFAVFAECTPIDGDEYRRWCEEEHFAAISKMSTWLRSEHYSLVFATVNMRSIEDQGPGVASR